MSEQNKELVRRFADEVVNRHDVDAANAIIADDFVEHEPGFGSGLGGFKEGFGMRFVAFPDLTVRIHELLAEGDKVVARMTYRGTHRGDFLGLAASGKLIQVHAMDIVRIDHDKMVEHWGLFDMLALLQQLEVVPNLGP